MWKSLTSFFRSKEEPVSYTQRRRYNLQEQTHLYVLGDVHGCNALLTKKIVPLYTGAYLTGNLSLAVIENNKFEIL